MYQTKNEKLELKIGDMIKCHDIEDMISTDAELHKNGICTDYRYEKDGEKGLWLEVLKVIKTD